MTPASTAATFCATLVDEWIHQGVSHAVIAPGSRSTPLALALCARSELSVHVFHDERAASFAALGIGLIGSPAVVLCTSGTAATHFHAAVVEAHQAAVPMIVCTADRPPELREVGAAQTIDQTRLYGTAVRWFYEPGVADASVAHTWRAIAARSYALSCGPLPGPVHINLAFREPLVATPEALPSRLPMALSTLTSSASPEAAVHDLARALAGRRGVIVAGRGSGDPATMVELADALGWPILADPRSGLRHVTSCAVTSFDSLLRDPTFAERFQPEVALRVGESPASKVLAAWLLGSGCDQFHLSSTARRIDPDAAINGQLVGDMERLCRMLAGAAAAHAPPTPSTRWRDVWLQAEAVAQSSFALTMGDELCEPLVAHTVTAALRAGDHLVVSSSMPIRDVEWFGQIADGVTVHANRGANGIDGVVATAIGVALGSGQATTLLIGDVAFLHDSAALVGLGARGVDLRIVVVDNDGGGIFSFLAQGEQLAPPVFERLFGTPHGVDLGLIAGAHGLAHAEATSKAELIELIQVRGPRVIVVHTDRDRNVVTHRQINVAVAVAVAPLTGE